MTFMSHFNGIYVTLPPDRERFALFHDQSIAFFKKSSSNAMMVIRGLELFPSSLNLKTRLF